MPPGPSGDLCATCGVPLPAGARFCASCGAAIVVEQAPEVRKVVTILFADVVGSTALGERLDPEATRTLLAAHFAIARTALERHGATVEKFIGDAVMAVFGIPELHEDDALRAVRAAADMRDGFAARAADDGLPVVRVRIGVNTGEVVAGDPANGETLVTGDPVNVAARLEQSAPAGEILIGAETLRLVRDAVQTEPVEPLTVKGKREPIEAHRLVSVFGDHGRIRQLGTPLVGRSDELENLRATWSATVASGAIHCLTVVAPAGVGKSRLVGELTATVHARVLSGRCLAYGDGITYWPIRDVMFTAAGVDESDAPDAIHQALIRMLGGDEHADLIGRRLGGAFGVLDDVGRQEEIFWAVRRTFELLARREPLLIVVEDLHWAEPTLLDLLDYLVDMASGPILVLSTARPELFDDRPGWGAGAGRERLRLEPLGADASERLLESQLGGGAVPNALRARILAAAEGNALYVEEFLAMLRESGQLVESADGWSANLGIEANVIPPNVRALLAARLDRLPAEERTLAARASVAGRSFEVAALDELVPAALRGELARRLLSLVRKELLRPDESQLSAGDAFRFRHVLIRDAAYEMLSKSERADLHERFADWLETAAGPRIGEVVEIAAYHLEQAAVYRRALTHYDGRTESLQRRAAVHLRTAGRAARNREDLRASVSFLGRAVELAAEDDPERGWDMLMLSRALGMIGDADGARRVDAELAALVPHLGEARLSRHWRLGNAADRFWRAEPGSEVELERVARGVLQEAERAGDKGSMARALEAIGAVSLQAGRNMEEIEILRRAHTLAEDADDEQLALAIRTQLANRLQFAPVPRDEAEQEVQRMLKEDPPPFVRMILLDAAAVLAAQDLRGDDARRLLADARRDGEELQQVVPFLAADWPGAVAMVGFAIQDYAMVEAAVGPAIPMLEAAEDAWHLSPLAGALARAIALQPDRLTPNRQQEIEAWCELARQRAADADELSATGWRQPLALLASFRGQHDEAVRIGEEMVGAVRGSETLDFEAEAFLDYATVLRAAGRESDAREAAEWSASCARRKGSRAHLHQAERFLAG